MTTYSEIHPTSEVRRNSAATLVVLMGILALGSVLQVSAGGASLGSIAGPECLLRNLVGERSCPGCGLTRASSLVLHGEFSRAWAVNVGGFFLVGTLGLWSMIHLWIMATGRRTTASIRWLTVSRRILLFGVILGWILRSI